MGTFEDWFYKYNERDILVVPGIDPVLFKVSRRNFGRDDGKYIFPHKYYNGIGVKLIQDDLPASDGFRKFSLRFNDISDKTRVIFFAGKYIESALYRPKSVLFHKGCLEKAIRHLS